MISFKAWSIVLLTAIVAAACVAKPSTNNSGFLANYKGVPYSDSLRAGGIQKIPGKVECEFYDIGGDSLSYFDSDRNNNGSGSLNKGEGYLNNFRIGESPDISYTKFHDSIDNSPYSIVQPKEGELYLGWTEPGEWTRYTVEVKETGRYKIGTMYTSNRGGAIRLYLDDTDSTANLNIPSTYNENEPIAWRQWHHWNFADSLTTVTLTAGKHILTLEIAEQGNFNFDYLLFSKME
ncbi:MAG: carbohydrate-binding protein [Bacteroidales bacterium]|nr:carbohydrate-binding protein [Bacteroidales bacterium]MCB8999352.1 carbohydrate-binding protein [Bacteroidales bacterium]MCB9013405.1 carbohydrate-binding protein [Bacteroidales bacterium]